MFFHGLICCELINNFPDAFMWDNYVAYDEFLAAMF